MKSLFCFFIGISLSSHAWADANTLTWNQAVEVFQKNNPEYRSAVGTFESTRALEGVAEAGDLPTVYGSLEYDRTKAIGYDAADLYSASLNVSQNLFSGLSDFYKTSQAKANTRVARAQLQSASATLSDQFITAYQNLITAQETLKLAQSIVERRKGDLELVELRFEGGRENKGSVLLSQAYLDQANYETLQAQHALRLAQISLAHFLQVPVTEIGTLTDPVPEQAPGLTPNFVEIATQTPDTQAILAQVDANIAGVGVARSAFFPTLNLTGSLGRSGPDYFPQYDRWAVGAVINIPLFNGLRDISNVHSTSFLRDSSKNHRITVEDAAVENLQLAFQSYTEAVEKLKVDASFRKAAVMRAEIARAQYNNGLLSYVDWDNIETDLINREKAYVTSEKQRVLSEAAWNQARGAGVLR